MNYQDRLSQVVVLGAAGKMGSGIVLLTAMEIANLRLSSGAEPGEANLFAIDVSSSALNGLMKYLRSQVLKSAEKLTVQLRQWYASRQDLIENEDIIRQYVEDVLSVVKPSLRLEAAFDAQVIFEAVSENPELKVKLFSTIRNNNPNQPWFLTNTSSIPIHELNQHAGLNGNIAGFHFYNPPAVQKLMEIILPEGVNPELGEFSKKLASNLRKVIVYSNDIAGFIGNGFFMRDILHAASETEHLSREMPLYQAIYVVDKITRDLLVRPMGIFQLSDYVGIDVCLFIMDVMDKRLPGESLRCPLLETFRDKGITGGQFADGSQKDGIFKYSKGQVVAVFDADQDKYIDISEFAGQADDFIGAIPSSWKPWKTAIKDKNRDELLREYFSELSASDTPGSLLAINYLRTARKIGEKLVNDGVSASAEDVNTVMMTGFFHAYGPVNDFIK